MAETGQTSGHEAILCAPLLRKVDTELIALLRSLQPAEWDFQTVSPKWTVRDVAAHLLDTALRKLSLVRDRCLVDAANPKSAREVIDLVNRLNREGVTIYRRLSPAVLIDLMAITCDQFASFHESLDPFSRAFFSVSWAGETTSLNWFDTARELTERWHHQQQIRLATDRPGIMTPELYHPVLDCFLRGLPYTYRHRKCPPGTNVLLDIRGDCGGTWVLSAHDEGWTFLQSVPTELACEVAIPQEIAWLIFTKGIAPSAVREQVEVKGDSDLAAGILSMTSIVG